MKKQTKEFGIYLWDTFDNETIFIDEADTRKEAEDKIEKEYKDRISPRGADVVEIVNLKGDIFKKYHIC